MSPAVENGNGYGSHRSAFIERDSSKCKIQVSLAIDGGALDLLPHDAKFPSLPDQQSQHHASQTTRRQAIWIWTGVGFFDHMLHALAKHAGWSLRVRTLADLAIDDHHSIEETCLALGVAFTTALGDRKGLARYGFAFAPLDEALCRAVVDLSNRPFFIGQFGFREGKIGDMSTQMVWHALQSFSQTGGITLHVDVLRGDNDHHRCEAAFKALAVAVKMASEHAAGWEGEVISTKGVL